MIFHQAPGFREALQSTAAALGIRFILVEKDYWVTRILQDLAFSEFRDLVQFQINTAEEELLLTYF